MGASKTSVLCTVGKLVMVSVIKETHACVKLASIWAEGDVCEFPRVISRGRDICHCLFDVVDWVVRKNSIAVKPAEMCSVVGVLVLADGSRWCSERILGRKGD